jgi:prolyl-tRNA synthetase
LFARAKAFRDEHTRKIDTKDEFYAFFADPAKKKESDPTPIHGGFALTHYNGDPAVEAKIKEDLKVTVRCIPLEAGEPGTCPFTGAPSKQRVVWAKSY